MPASLWVTEQPESWEHLGAQLCLHLPGNCEQMPGRGGVPKGPGVVGCGRGARGKARGAVECFGG